MEILNITPIQKPDRINMIKTGCGCSGPARKAIDEDNPPRWASGVMETPVGRVFRVATVWSRPDYWGQVKARISGFRMNYSVEPGLYAVGDPGRNSDILVSANYKLSFDVLRRELNGLNAWILVLDTKGINVWCAAGKGTFGTEELVTRITMAGLASLVGHRRIILPQLGAPGVDADAVKKWTGFRVSYGPVRASDIPAYLSRNYTATGEMRTIKFTLLDRLILTPMELIPVVKAFPKYALIVLVIFGLQPAGIMFGDALRQGWPVLLLGIAAIIAGAVATPLFLPFIPFRSFAIKGWIAGTMLISPVLYYGGMINGGNWLFLAFSYLLFPVVSSYLALQFTGATTFTNLSGVIKELRAGMPLYKAALVFSLILAIAYKIKGWGVL